MKHSVYYYYGVICGLLAGLLLVAIIFAIQKKQNKACEFDERQELMRGKAFKYGFSAMLIYTLGYSLFADITGFSWEDELTSGLIIVVMGLGVFTATCIWKDAYFALKEKKTGFILLALLLMITNFTNGYDHIKHPKNNDSPVAPYFAISFLCLFILVNLGLKSIYEKKRREME